MNTYLVDWFRVICDIRKAGLSQTAAAKKVGVSQRTISNYMNGWCEPSYSDGVRLLELRKKLIGATT